MMSNEANERLKRDTQHVPLRQNAEGKSTREGAKRGVGRHERMKHGRGMQGREGIEIRITDDFVIIKPTVPFKLEKHEV